ncbi:hypothetical protein BX616_005631, partial [Lobosporangium transversale]
TIAKVLFEKLQIYSSRPLTPFIRTTPRAGKFLSTHLKQLLREKCPVSLVDNPTDLRTIPESILTSAFLETIKTRLLFASPLIVNARSGDNINEDEMNNNYRDLSSSTEVHVEVWLPEEQARGILAIPGWIRERASECLFNGDEDALSVTDTILETIAKVPSDLRRPLISSMLLIGGTAQLPNIQSRLLQEIRRSLQSNPKWAKLAGLVDSVRFLDDLTAEDKAALSTAVGFVGGGAAPAITAAGASRSNTPSLSRSHSMLDQDEGSGFGPGSAIPGTRDREKKSGSKEKKPYQSSGKVFMPNCRSWIGGSLVGSLKVSGPEILRENFNGTVPDWSTASLSATQTHQDAATTSSMVASALAISY